MKLISQLTFPVLLLLSLLIVFPSCSVNKTGSTFEFSENSTSISDNLQTQNLVAWCIVPFDAKQRGPEERAKMLKELGILRCAYDWREKHVPEFEEEILQYQKYGIEYFAFWGYHEKAFELFKKYDLHPQVWMMMKKTSAQSQEERIQEAVKNLEKMARMTQEMDCKLGLYNHGGWEGEPKNMVAVCQQLHKKGYDHVGIIYNWHHGHEHIENWEETLALIQPYLLCLNLNGMSNPQADPKILPLAQGKHEAAMLKTLKESGYDGPIGILDHLNEVDTKVALENNLRGLEQLKKSIAENN